MTIAVNNFTDSDLNVDKQLLWEHNLNTRDLIPIWYDSSGIQIATFGIFQIVDANNIILNCNDTITGTHSILLQYDAGTQVVTGRRLFELTDQDPTDDSMIAHGGAGVPTYNSKWSRLKELLASIFAPKDLDNLEFITSPADARSYLGVYAKSEVNPKIDAKAELYQSGSGAVLGVANTKDYDAIGDNYPATQIFVNNKIAEEEINYGSGVSDTLTVFGKDPAITINRLTASKAGNVVTVQCSFEVSTVNASTSIQVCAFTDSDWIPSNYRTANCFLYPISGQPSNANAYVLMNDTESGIIYLSNSYATPAGVANYNFTMTYVV